MNMCSCAYVTVYISAPDRLWCSRTLEYLIRHLSRVSTHHHSTGMTAKNLAIVWAPNLVRSQQLEMGGVAALQVRHTAGTAEFRLISHTALISHFGCL